MEEDDDALTEKEWRDMRRRLPSLQFEPVPETPELLPRSFYDDEGDEETRDDPSPVSSSMRRQTDRSHQDDVVHTDSEMLSSSSPGLQLAMLDLSSASFSSIDAAPVALAWSRDSTPRDEKRSRRSNPPSRSPAQSVPSSSPNTVIPPAVASLKPVKPRSITSPCRKPCHCDGASSYDRDNMASTFSTLQSPVDLTNLDASITTAHEQLRLTILRAVQETTMRHEREATLEKRKLEAAHANRVALLQSQLDELQTENLTQQQQVRDAAETLGRATKLMMKQKQYQRARWSAPLSMHACFQAWKQRSQTKKNVKKQEQVANHFQTTRSQQSVLHQWKLQTHRNSNEKKLETQQNEHSRVVELLKQNYETQLQDLQRELEDAHATVAVAHHTRQQLEGDLRQVFLRGVSAMNIEALTLFKANSQQRHAQLLESGTRDAQPQHYQSQRQEQSYRAGSADVVREATRSATGGERSGELASEARMVPIMQSTDSGTVQSPLPDGSPTCASHTSHRAMPSSAVASQLLTHAGSAEITTFPASTDSPSQPPTPPTAAVHGLRSAEIVEAHQRLLHATAARQPPPSSSVNRTPGDPRSVRSLSPARQRVKIQNSMSFNVEMALVQSSVATAVALNARYPVTATASSQSRRAGSLHSSSHSASLSSSRRSSSSSTLSTQRLSHS